MSNSAVSRTVLSALVALALTAADFGPSRAQSQPDPAGATPQEGTSATIRHIVESAHHPYLRWPDFPYYQDEMEAVYGPVDFAPLWFESRSLTPQAHTVLDLLLEADNLGLDPEGYDAGRLQGIREELQGGRQLSPSEIGLVDAAFSIAILRHISDAHIGRVNPENLSFGFNIEEKKYDLPKLLQDAIAGNRIAEAVAEAEPDLPQYWRLKEALARYRALAESPDLHPVRVSATISQGDRYEGTPALRSYLAGLGDLSRSAAQQAASNATRYEGAVVEGVKRFQERHGLNVDGVIGPATADALAVPLDRRVTQIELALERFRWLPNLRDEPFVAVNVPAFELWGFEELGEDELPFVQMRVVVGKALNKQTPVFIENMTYLEFAPYWNIPYSIAVNEILPHVRQDPGYLAAHRYEIVREFTNDPGSLPATAENIDRIGSGGLKLRQLPGPTNSLGLVKFIFPNAANVYLHSTPATQLFGRSRRDFSHGCIRVEEPVGLADFVLRDAAEWDRTGIEGAMNADRPTRVVLDRPLSVIIFYSTVLVDPDGSVSFYEDIYGHDAILEKALEAGYPYPP